MRSFAVLASLSFVGLGCFGSHDPIASDGQCDCGAGDPLEVDISDAGELEATGGFSIRERSSRGDASIELYGSGARGGDFGRLEWTVPLTLDETRQLVDGDVVAPSSETAEVRYPIDNGAILRPVERLQLEIFDDGAARATLYLGDALGSRGSPPRLLDDDAIVTVVGVLRVHCWSSGAGPHLESPFCRGVLAETGLERVIP